MSRALRSRIAGIGFWCNGLPDWDSACAFARTGALPADAPSKPSPQLLPANERRRAPETVAVALDVAMAACRAAGRDPVTLPSVFTSTHGELAITDYMAATLASDPKAISPIRFHNSVHNAAAGYWTIGTGCTQPATALSAYQASFAEGLLEALLQLQAGAESVLLVACDGHATGPLGAVSPSTGLLGAALVLTGPSGDGTPLQLDEAASPCPEAAPGPLQRHAAGNAMAPMLPLFDALAAGTSQARLYAGPHRHLQLTLAE